MYDIDRIARRELRRREARDEAIRTGRGRPGMLGINHMAGFGAGGDASPLASRVLGMHMDGTNGGTTFTDVKGHTIGRVGATTSTAQSKFGGASAVFNGTSDYLYSSASSDWAFGTGDFTVTGWVYMLGVTAEQIIAGTVAASGDNGQWNLEIYSGNFRFTSYGSVYLSTGSVSTSTWTHFEVSRSGTTLKLFVGGTETHSVTNSTDFHSNSATSDLNIGRFGIGGAFLQGYIDDLEIYKGVALHTASFTAPTSAFADS